MPRIISRFYSHRIFLPILNAILNALLLFFTITLKTHISLRKNAFVKKKKKNEEKYRSVYFISFFFYHSRFSIGVSVRHLYREFLRNICYSRNNLKQPSFRFVSLCPHPSRLFLRKFPSATLRVCMLCVCMFAHVRVSDGLLLK